MVNSYSLAAITLVLLASSADAFSTGKHVPSSQKITSQEPTLQQQLSRFVLASTIFVSAASGLVTPAAFADEIGRETEAPTLYTGESVMICQKRGPLGACKKSVKRTEANDNDVAQKYFVDPGQAAKEKEEEMRASGKDDSNALIVALKQRTEDNKEINADIVRQKTAENDSSASFGPFDRQVLITNANGKGFVLLENPQAMRLKKAGFIKGKQFIKQPTVEEIEQALEAEETGVVGFINGFFKEKEP